MALVALMDLSGPGEEWTALFPAARDSAEAQLKSRLVTGGKTASMQRKMDAAEFWRSMTHKGEQKAAIPVPSVHDDPETEYEVKEAAFLKVAMSPAQTQGLSMGAGALLGGTYGAVKQYQASMPRAGGLSRDQVSLRAKLYARQTNASNEGEGRYGAMRRRLVEMHLGEADKFKSHPGRAAAVSAIPHALGGAAIGYLAGKKLAP